MAFEAWLAGLQEAGMGPWPLRPIVRGAAYYETITLQGDRSADAFDADLRTAPVDDPDATTPDDSFTINVGAYDAATDETEIELSLTATEAHALDAGTDGVAEMVWDLLWTPDGESDAIMLTGGVVKILGGVSDNA